MGLESGEYINSLVATNPLATDEIQQGDDHIRLLKSTIKNTFPNVAGEVTASHTELSLLGGVPATLTTTEIGYLDGVTSALQAQLDAKVGPAGVTFENLDSNSDVGRGSDQVAPGDITQGQQTIYVPAGAMIAQSTDGPAAVLEELSTNDVMVVGFDFDQSTKQYVQFEMQMPKSWDQGTFVVETAWKDADSSGTGDVVWGAAALFCGDSDSLDAAFGTEQTVTDSFQSAGDLHKSGETAAITPSGTPGAEGHIVMRVSRVAADGGDTYNELARLLGVRVHYATNDDTDD